MHEIILNRLEGKDSLVLYWYGEIAQRNLGKLSESERNITAEVLQCKSSRLVEWLI